MSNYVVLNNSAHKDLKVNTTRSEIYGDNVMHAMTFPLEFRDVQSCYPIFFCKDSESGQFYPTALFGLEHNENLFLTEDGWNASYIPMMIRRYPFLVGYQEDNSNESGKKPVVSIDLDNPRLNKHMGEALFQGEGEPTTYLNESISMLEAIHRGHEHNRGFIQTLLKYDLLESFTLEVTLNNGSKNELKGFYTIAEQKLHELSGDVFELLNKRGYLQAIFMAVASHSRLRPIVEKKNALQI
jgi:hypothetical protein